MMTTFCECAQEPRIHLAFKPKLAVVACQLEANLLVKVLNYCRHHSSLCRVQVMQTTLQGGALNLVCCCLVCAALHNSTTLSEQHGRAAHAATYWIAGVRDKRARQLGSRACRRLTWGDDQDHRQATSRQPHPALAALLCMR